MSLERFVDKATTRQANTELAAEANIEKVRDRFKVLINKPEQRDETITDWFLNVYINRLAEDIGVDAAKGLGIALAELVDLPFDKLMEVPIFQRSLIWDTAANIIIAVSSRQANMESDLIKSALIDGIENVKDLDKETNKLSESEIKDITINMKDQMAEKKGKKARKNA